MQAQAQSVKGFAGNSASNIDLAGHDARLSLRPVRSRSCVNMFVARVEFCTAARGECFMGAQGTADDNLDELRSAYAGKQDLE